MKVVNIKCLFTSDIVCICDLDTIWQIQHWSLTRWTNDILASGIELYLKVMFNTFCVTHGSSNLLNDNVTMEKSSITRHTSRCAA